MLPKSFATGSDEPFVPLRSSKSAQAQLRESCEAMRGRVKGVRNAAPPEENNVRMWRRGDE